MEDFYKATESVIYSKSYSRKIRKKHRHDRKRKNCHNVYPIERYTINNLIALIEFLTIAIVVSYIKIHRIMKCDKQLKIEEDIFLYVIKGK